MSIFDSNVDKTLDLHGLFYKFCNYLKINFNFLFNIKNKKFNVYFPLVLLQLQGIIWKQ